MADSGPPQDPFEMFRRLWGPLGVPLPGMAMPTLANDSLISRDVVTLKAELEKFREQAQNVE